MARHAKKILADGTDWRVLNELNRELERLNKNGPLDAARLANEVIE